MEPEREFARERFQIVKQRLDDPATHIDRLDRIQLEREYRLLGKVLDEVSEGQVLRTLEAWRRYLGGELATYSRKVLPSIRQAHEEWRQLPPARREFVPEPPRPVVSTTVTDRNGYKWVIDDRFLLMMDDVIARLRRWLESDE
jgi:hypothetical protein